MSLVTNFLFITVFYFIGSIPFALILTKLLGHGDIRNIGSGNVGATNVLRTGNKYLAFAVLCLDIAKGLLPFLILKLFYVGIFLLYLFLIISLKHRENIKRLMNGSENKIKLSK